VAQRELPLGATAGSLGAESVLTTKPQLTALPLSRSRSYALGGERISTRPLAEEEGFIREALTSLYGLFATTRDTLKASRPSVPV
jgi:hypothetical protein